MPPSRAAREAKARQVLVGRRMGEAQREGDEHAANGLAQQAGDRDHAAGAGQAVLRRGGEHGLVVGRLHQREAAGGHGDAPGNVEIRGRGGQQAHEQKAEAADEHAQRGEQRRRITVRQPADEGGGEHDGERPGGDDEPCFHRAAMQHVGEVEGHRDDEEIGGDEGQETGGEGGGETAAHQQVHRQQRVRAGELQAHQQRHGHQPHQQQHGAKQPARALREMIPAGDDARQPHRQQRRTQPVELHVRARGFRQRGDGEIKRHRAERQVDEEQPFPGGDGEHGGGNGGPQRHAERDDQPVQGDAAAQNVARIDMPHQGGIDAEDAGAAQPLHRAGHGQLRQGLRDGAEQRGADEHDEPDAAHAGMAEFLTQRGHRQQRDDIGELIGVDDPDGSGIGGMHIARDAGHGDVDHRVVQHRKQNRHGHGEHGPHAGGFGQAILNRGRSSHGR